MNVEYYSYRFAKEILEHPQYTQAWDEISSTVANAPLFIWPNKSVKNPKFYVVQQIMNTYFDRVFAADLGWELHPLATDIEDSGLKADFRKTFNDLAIQSEVQFGNMSRWYSDIFKFQTAYSQKLINMGICVVPKNNLGKFIGSNVTNYERIIKELPSAFLSITLPVLVVGIDQDNQTQVLDVSKSRFNDISELAARKSTDNRFRIVNGVLSGVPIEDIGPDSPTGLVLGDSDD